MLLTILIQCPSLSDPCGLLQEDDIEAEAKENGAKRKRAAQEESQAVQSFNPKRVPQRLILFYSNANRPYYSIFTIINALLFSGIVNSPLYLAE